MLTRFYVLLIGLSFSAAVFAQPTFFKTYGTGQSDYGNHVTVTPQGDYLLTMIGVVQPFQDTGQCYPPDASRYGAGLVKTDNNGEKIWEQVYWMAMRCQGVKTIIDAEGNYVMIGDIVLGTGVLTTRTFVIKADTAGNVIWAKEYTLSQSDKAVDILNLPNNQYALISSGDDNVWYERIGISIIDKDGAVIKSALINRPAGEFTPTGAALLNNNRIAISGIGGGVSFFTDVVVLIVDLNLNVINSSRFGTYYDDMATGITEKNGSLYITGYSFFMASYYDVFALKLDDNLNILKQAFFTAGGADDDKWRVIVPTDKGIAAFGDVGSFEERNCMMAELDDNLNLLWAKQYAVNPIYTNYIQGATYLQGKGFLWTGDVRPPDTYRNAALVKTDKQGDAGCITAPITLTRTAEVFTDSFYAVLDSFKTCTVMDLAICTPKHDIRERTYCERLAPSAAMLLQEEQMDCGNFCYNIRDVSTNNPLTWQWNFAGGSPNTYIGQNPRTVCFTETGSHAIQLITTNDIGTDTAIYTLNIDTNCALQYIIPNAFSPNGDGTNETFEVIGRKENWKNFNLNIYNRWGEVVFTSTDPYFKWDGSLMDKRQPIGSYTYTLQFSYFNMEKNVMGNLTLLR
jgi:gliding motility-associated-like protein